MLYINLPPEGRARPVAYVSRSPASFRQNLLKLLEEKELDVGTLLDGYSARACPLARRRRKRASSTSAGVVGYGHGSVAEHAVAHMALEDVSILASKVIEDNRLASYTEKSTRYQVFDRGRYHKPESPYFLPAPEGLRRGLRRDVRFLTESLPSCSAS